MYVYIYINSKGGRTQRPYTFTCTYRYQNKGDALRDLDSSTRDTTRVSCLTQTISLAHFDSSVWRRLRVYVCTNICVCRATA